MILPVILCGGSGTRLWPLSRDRYPKQFQALLGDKSLYQDTLCRVAAIPEALPALIVTNHEHRFTVAEQARQAGKAVSRILLEPIGRNTAPAIALAAHWAVEHAGDPLLLICPADHVIKDERAFRDSVVSACSAADTGNLVTFGIVAQYPETGYGYIQRGESLSDAVFRVSRFVEKPTADTAKAFVEDGSYYWNSGMFLFRASVYLRELAVAHPEMSHACETAYAGIQSSVDFVRIPLDEFKKTPSDSIDYAVMEKTSVAAVVPTDPEWSDVGAWSAVWEIAEKDADGNVYAENVISIDCHNSYVKSEKLAAVIGIDNVVVVDTPDALLIMDRKRSQDVKQIVTRLKQQGRTESDLHRKVYRPWGWYDSIDTGERFQVKRIQVNPGACLSLQMHHHRAEHWIVVRGTAQVTCDDKKILLSENQSTYLPLGAVHRLENPGKVPLELIEVQSGSYLGEDDIVRFEDTYGRDSTGC